MRDHLGKEAAAKAPFFTEEEGRQPEHGCQLGKRLRALVQTKGFDRLDARHQAVEKVDRDCAAVIAAELLHEP